MIQEQQNQTEFQEVESIQKKWMKKYLPIIFIGILIGAGALFVIINLAEDRNESVLSQKEGMGSEINASDWKNYRNEKLEFEFQYPAEFGTDENDGYPYSGDVIVALRRLDGSDNPFPFYGDWSFSISGPAYENTSIEEKVRNIRLAFKDEENYQESEVTVSGRKYSHFSYVVQDWRDDVEVQYIIILIPNKNGYIGIDWKSLENISDDETVENEKMVLNKVLSTFKFTGSVTENY